MKLSECWKGRVVTLVDKESVGIGLIDKNRRGVPVVGHIERFDHSDTRGTCVCVDWGHGYSYMSTVLPEQIKPYED